MTSRRSLPPPSGRRALALSSSTPRPDHTTDDAPRRRPKPPSRTSRDWCPGTDVSPFCGDERPHGPHPRGDQLAVVLSDVTASALLDVVESVLEVIDKKGKDVNGWGQACREMSETLRQRGVLR